MSIITIVISIALNFVRIPSLHQYYQYLQFYYEKKNNNEYIIIMYNIMHTAVDREVRIINFLATYDQFHHMSALIRELYDFLDV